MNRPEKRNALSGDMLAIMSDAWDRVNEDDDIRVVHPDRVPAARSAPAPTSPR